VEVIKVYTFRKQGLAAIRFKPIIRTTLYGRRLGPQAGFRLPKIGNSFNSLVCA